MWCSCNAAHHETARSKVRASRLLISTVEAMASMMAEPSRPRSKPVNGLAVDSAGDSGRWWSELTDATGPVGNLRQSHSSGRAAVRVRGGPDLCCGHPDERMPQGW